MTVPTTAWNETVPPDTEAATDGNDRIMEMKQQIREIVDIDHKFDSSGQDADMGKHNIVHILTSAASPASAAGEIILYQKEDGDSRNQLYCMDDEGNAIQMTLDGALNAVLLTGVQTVVGAKTFSNDGVFSADLTVDVDLAVGNDLSVTVDALIGGTLGVTGITTLGAALVMGTNKITGLGDGSGAQDAAAFGQLSVLGLDIGTYAGDGAATQGITGVGFQPTLVLLWKQGGTEGSPVIKTSSDPGLYSKRFSAGGWAENQIRSLDADGFTVGTHDTVNESAKTYTYVAIKGA